MREFKRYIVWGSAGHAKVIADIVRSSGGEIEALFDNNPNAQACLESVPLFLGLSGFQAWCLSQGSLEEVAAVIAIGGHHGHARRQIADHLRSAGLTLPSIVHSTAALSATARIGEGCHILANAVVAADSVLGNACIVNNSASVDHECSLGSGVHVGPGATLCGCVVVEDDVMIGAGAVVLPRLRLGAGSTVGAGAVVTLDVPKGTVVVGNPAKILRSLK